MNSIKCQKCGLTNFSSEIECRRCGNEFAQHNKRGKVEKRPRSFPFSSLLVIACVGGFAYYMYKGAESSVDEVNSAEAKRVASQPSERPVTPGLSRTQYDQKKAGTYADAVKNSESLNAHQKRVEDTEKTVQQLSGANK